MVLTGKIIVLKYQSKSFKNDKNEVIPYYSVEFADKDYNKFSASVPKDCLEKVDLLLDASIDSPSVEGVGTFEITVGEKGPKFRLVEFKAE